MGGKKKEGRAGKFSLWVVQCLFLWPSWLCAASWWEAPCPAPSLNTTQDCLAHMSVQVAGRTHRFESSRSLDCNSREDVSLNVSAVVWVRCLFFWDVTTCHYIVLKRRELNAQRRRIHPVRTSPQKWRCMTSVCVKLLQDAIKLWQNKTVFLNCQYFWALSTVLCISFLVLYVT